MMLSDFYFISLLSCLCFRCTIRHLRWALCALQSMYWQRGFVYSVKEIVSIACYMCGTYTWRNAKNIHKRQTHLLVREDVKYVLFLWGFFRKKKYSGQESRAVLRQDERIGDKPPTQSKSGFDNNRYRLVQPERGVCVLLTFKYSKHVLFLILLISLVVACLWLSERWSIRPTVVDYYFSLWKFMDLNISLKKTVHRNSSLLLTICFTDNAKLAKSPFLHFKCKIYFTVITTDSQLFWLLRINQTLPGNESQQWKLTSFCVHDFILRLLWNKNLEYQILKIIRIPQ
jgi:hypothetical protein